ncbi:unnamed protein product [Musa hybrid cultivar]
MASGLINANPVVYERKERQVRSVPTIIDEDAEELIDQQEIFDILIFRTLLIIFFWGLCEQRVNSNYSMPDNIQKPHLALCHSGGSRCCELSLPTSKNTQTKAKHTVRSLYKHAKAVESRILMMKSIVICCLIYEVQPPRPGGGTAWAESSSETGRCNRPSQEVAPPEPSLRARLGGATSLTERWHRLSSVFELWQRGATASPWSSAYAYESCVPPRENFECKDIQDPEHPYTLEELKVVTEDSIEVNDKQSHVSVTFTPTVEHCSLATTIGLCLRVKLMRNLPSRYKVDIRVAPGTHATEAAVNKQLNDKERVVAALENPNLMYMIDRCLEPTFYY